MMTLPHPCAGWGVPPEPHQAQTHVSTTMLRMKQGKPLLSVERLPKWAQKALAGSDGGGATPGLQPEAQAMPEAAQPAAAGAAGAAPPAPAERPQPVNKWARNIVAQQQLDAQAAAACPVVAVVPALRPAAGPEQEQQQLQRRTWAEAAEDDDEMLYCAPMDDELGSFDVHLDEAAAEAEQQLAQECGSGGEAPGPATTTCGAADVLTRPTSRLCHVFVPPYPSPHGQRHSPSHARLQAALPRLPSH